METVWFTRNVVGAHMKLVNLPFVYQLGAEMHELLKKEPKARLDVLIASLPVRYSIERLLNEYPVLTTSRKPGDGLVSAIKQIMEWFEEMKLKEKPNWDVSDSMVDLKFHDVLDQAKNFEPILKADLLENLVAYHPQEKALYSTAKLITNAEKALHVQDLKKLEQNTIREIRESGRCLAFDNYTASGFHMLRALELVLHDYYVIFCKPANPSKHLENWSAYLVPLYQLFHDEDKSKLLVEEEKGHVKKVYYLLQQIRDLDRNNIMHAETFLNEMEALKLFDVVKTAIMVMAEKLPDKPQAKII